MRIVSWNTISLLLAAALLAPAPARAQQVAPLVPHFEAPMGAEMIIRFHEAMAKGLKSGGLKVISAETVRKKLGLKPELAGCFSGMCKDRAQGMLGLKRLAVAKVSTIGKNYTIAIRLYNGSKLLGSGKARCDICTFNEAIGTMKRVAEELGTRAEEPPPDKPAPRPVVKPRPVPKPVPKPAPKPVVKPRPVVKPKPVVPAPPVEPDQPEPETPKTAWPMWPALASGGVGLAALGGGIALIAIDGNGAECVGDPRDDLRNCSRLYDTGTFGWIMTGVGIGAVVASGVLFYLHLSSKPKERAAAAVENVMVTTTPSGGVVFGAAGRF